MPFTLSHPAAVLPIRSKLRWTSLSALVLGSMTPDFAYFLPFGQWGGFSHSLPGIFGFCIPFGLLAYFIFHILIKEPIWRILPWVLRCRLDPKCSRWQVASLRALLATAGSIAIGALTHIVWDGFTHKSSEFVRIISWLSGTVSLGSINLPRYKLLQHLSSILGLCILAFAAYGWVKTARVLYIHQTGGSGRNSMRTLLVLLILGVGGFANGLLQSHASTVERTLFDGAIRAIGTLVGASFLYCIFIQMKIRSRQRHVSLCIRQSLLRCWATQTLNVMRQSRLLEFSSSAFAFESDEDSDTNPGIVGRSLSRWIASKLNEIGIPTGEVIPEDFGWCVPVQSAQHKLYIACANVADEPTRWRVFAFAEGGLLARLIGKEKSAESVASLFVEIKWILQASSDIHNLKEEAA